MYSRKQIVGNESYTHITFRCLNREFLFKDKEVKIHILHLWAKYHRHYRIKIFAFIIMDNHAHMIVQTPSAEHLGHFMRTVNSQIARFINKFYERDSHALKERYKSPIITDSIYMRRTLQYVWLNRYKVDSKDPSKDPFCSVSWQMHPDMLKSYFGKYEKAKKFSDILTSLTELPASYKGTFQELRDLLNDAIGRIKQLTKEIFQNEHTIGDPDVVLHRGQMLNSGRKCYFRWVPT